MNVRAWPGPFSATQEIKRAGQLSIPREAFQFGAEIVRRPGTGQFSEYFIGRHHDTRARRSRAASAPPSEINRCQDGLESIHQQTLFAAAAGGFLAAAQLQIPAEIELVRGGQQMRGADQVVLEQGKLAFSEIPKAGKQPFADEPAENRVAQEFKAFVIGLRATPACGGAASLALELCVTARASRWRFVKR